MNPEKIYPRTNDHETVYLKNVIKNPNILVGNFTMYNDFVYDPRQFEKNNVLYHYPINHDKLIMENSVLSPAGQSFCSPAPTIQKHPCPPIRSRSFLRNGDWMSRT